MEGIHKLMEAYEVMRQASIQNHTGHFDLTGRSGGGCPECLRARDLRLKADNLYSQAVQLMQEEHII